MRKWKKVPAMAICMIEVLIMAGGAERAKSIALEHAGFSETDVSRLKCDFDVDDGQTVYEVEFTKDGKEYEYTVSAADGMIIAYEAD